MSDELTVQIDADGRVKPQGVRLRRWLAGRSGLWQLVPSAENLLVFHRLGAQGEESQSSRTGELQLTGSIGAMGGLTDVITFLSNTKRTGALVVLADLLKKTLFFHEGDVRMATSNVPEDRLGALLYRFGQVTHDQLEQALGEQSGARRLGRVLIDMGILSPHELYTAIRRQVEEIFYSVLLIRSGVFYFYNLEGESHATQQLNLRTQNLLLEGVRRIDEMSYFRERIPSSLTVLEVRADITPKQLGDVESKVYALVDGHRPIDDIARESQLGEFETTRVLFHLMQLGYVQRRRDTNISQLPMDAKGQPSRGSYEALIEIFNTVFRKIFKKIEDKDKDSSLRQGIDSFFEGATGFVELFRNVKLQGDGALPVETLLGNLQKLERENPMEFLYNGLNELLFFQMFTAGEALPAEDEEQLQKELASIFQGLSA
ncbi:MAG: DUF4388 domain-containing protein [Polyangia bacterium]|nr:DUF4388 domain-containing protein [Polyangia bacterium]